MNTITKQTIMDVKACCHHGHGASVFMNADGGLVVYQSVSSQDVIARSRNGGWDYRIRYITGNDITRADILDQIKYAIEQRKIEIDLDEQEARTATLAE